MTGNSEEDTGRRYKVKRLVDEYELDELGTELERRWTASGDDRMSLRDLADYFNRRLLAKSMADADVHVLDGEVENVYRLLTEENLTAERTEAVRTLEREGVDVEALRGDFVSYQSVRTYLKNALGSEYESESRDQRERELQTIRQMRGRMEAVVDSKIEQLREHHDLKITAPQPIIGVDVVCNSCGEQLGVDELLDGGACGCYDGPE